MDMKKGFTLIEIMVVIAILGVLITMISGSFLASQKKSRDLKRKSDIVQMGKALEFYFNDQGRYPASNLGVMTGCGNPASPADCAWGSIWANTVTTPNTVYMAKLPTDTTGKHYYYSSDAAGTYFQIYARLENTEDFDIHKSGTTVQTYTGTDCGSGIECQYGTSSSNTTPETGHALH
jgi:general secretion pathway protein G